MLRTFCAVAAVSFLTAVAGCGKREFKAFSPAEGGFRVEMPGIPKESNQNAGGISAKAYAVEYRQGAFVVSYADMPIPKHESAPRLEARLNGSRDGAIRNVGGTLVSESPIQLDEVFPGREFVAIVPAKKAHMRAQIFIVEGRLYQLIVVGSESTVKSADGDRFFNSFALTMPEFKEFSPPGGHFKVDMPGTPREEHKSVASGQMTVFTLEQNRGAFIIRCMELHVSKQVSAQPFPVRLNKARDVAIRSVDGKLVSESAVQLGGKYPGLEFLATTSTQNTHLRVRVFFVGGWFYQLSAIGTKTWIQSSDADRFFNSFAVTN